ncbi:hypothetical protein [Microvirga pudoricolor]|uniref:hypothetical protein n=1 Tax=Microvirga pudoricolor TaxID=2778729 RepID=UPI001951289D|nr:hypothetical protein [Microvirga pudoricolor]MBM6595492.1 hypothetical protein [Microvirga pudoricolor]
MVETDLNVVAFKTRSKPAAQSARLHPKGLIEAIYGAGSLAVPADDLSTKMAARMLQALGLIVIQVVHADGSVRVLDRSETRGAMDRPWRLAKPAFSGEIGVPDADGAFKPRV